MMKDIQEKELSFVARYFRAGLFNPTRAWRRFRAENRPVPGYSRPVWAYALAGVCAVVLAGLFLFRADARRWTTTAVAETVQEILLPDGSQAVLAPGATVAFHRNGFGKRDRQVRMEGTVYFAVARNEALPFEITAGDGFVRVLGTRFQVARRDGATSVDVVDGRVLFAACGAEDRGLILTRGMHAALAAGADRPVPGAAEGPNPAGWATHLYQYDNIPLEDVLRELGAQFGCTLSAPAGQRKLTGQFEGEDITEIVFLIEEALGTKITIQ
jgi:transmembrane sensor